MPAMKQRTTVLVFRQNDLSRVYEARKRKVSNMKNPLTFLTTEKTKFNGWINGIVKLIEDQKGQMERNNDESKTTYLMTSLENGQVEITVFLLIHNLAGLANENGRPTVTIIPAPAARGCCYEDRGSAHAWKITASLHNQSEWLCGNSTTPTKLEDLKWTDRPIDESYRCHFLESFTSFNEVLRARTNYYASRTARYMTVESRLTPCIAVRCDKHKRLLAEDPSRSFEMKRLKDSQKYRIILSDRKSNENSMMSEVENLREENERLSRALRRAAELHLSMPTEAEATQKEKEKLAEERRALEDERRNLQAQREKLRSLEECRTSIALEEKERLTEERKALEAAKQEFRLQRKEFKRSSAEDSSRLCEKERELEKSRRVLDLERQHFAIHEENLENRFEAMNSDFAAKERSLEEQRLALERDKDNLSAQRAELRRSSEASASKMRQEFEERKLMLERSNEAVASLLKDQERLVGQCRQRLERDQRELTEQRAMLRQQETASAALWREKRASLDERQTRVERFQEELLAKKRDFEEYYDNRNHNLREREEALGAQRRDLERDRRLLSEREEELVAQRDATRSTRPTVIVHQDDGIKIPIIPEILSWHIKLPSW